MSAISNHPNTIGVSKRTITSELGDNDSDCYEVTLWYTTYIKDSKETNVSKTNLGTASMNQVRFWLQPAEGMCG